MSEPLFTFWVDATNNSLISGWNGLVRAKDPIFKQGDNVSVEIHWIKKTSFTEGITEEIPFPSGSIVRVAVGEIDASPKSGVWIIGFGTDFANIDISADGTTVNTIVNSMPSVIAAGGVTVIIVNGSTYRITFNTNGAKVNFSSNCGTVYPSATGFTSKSRTGDDFTREVQSIKLKCIPVAYSDAFTDTPSATIETSIIETRTTRLAFTDVPKGGYFTISDGTLTSGNISVFASSTDVYSALLAAGMANSLTIPITVNKVDMYAWDIYQGATSLKTFSINTGGVISFSSKTGTIDFNTEEVEELLDSNNSINTNIEIEVSNGTVKHTIYQGKATIINDMIDSSTFNPSSLSSPASQTDLNAIEVRVTNLESNELVTNISNAQNNDVLAFNSSDSKWVNKSTLTTFTSVDGGNF